MEPATSSTVMALNQQPVYQMFFISNPQKEPCRLLFKVGYTVNGAQVNEMGDFTPNKV
jgi:ADP-ribosylation factor-binding protein GGA